MSVLHEWFSATLPASRDAAFLAVLIGATLFLFLRRLPPVWRHGLWMIVVVRLLLPTLPESGFSWRAWFAQAKDEAVPRGQVVFPEGADRFDPDVFEGIPVTRTVTSEPLRIARPPESRWTALTVLPPVWAVGMLICLTVMVFGWMRFQRRIARLERKHHPRKAPVEAMLGKLCSDLGFSRAPGVIITDAVDGPALAGWLRPRILLPVSATEDLLDPQLRLVLLHELGHLRRCDIAVNWLLGVLQAVHWFNPVIWWAFRRIRVETERATDEWVLRRCGSSSPTDYGETLIRLLESSQQGRHAIPGLIGVLESRFSLRSRLQAIGRFRGARRPGAMAVAVVALSGAAAIGLTQPPKEKVEDPPKAEPAPVAEKPVSPPPVEKGSQVHLSVKVWAREGEHPEQLIASPSTVVELGEWTSFQETQEIGYATHYGLPNLPEKVAAKATGGGTLQTKGEPESKWETNSKEVMLPPHPEQFERRPIGWNMKLRPDLTEDGKVRVACVFEQTVLKGFVNRGVPITAELPAGLLGREKSQTVAENRQMFPVFLKGRQEWIFEPAGDSLAPKMVSNVADAAPGDEVIVDGFADEVRSSALPKTRIEVTVTPVKTLPAPAGEGSQVYLSAKFVETDVDVLERFGTESALLTDPQFQVLIRFLSQQKGVDLFSAPSITIPDGETGSVQVHREFAYPTHFDAPVLSPKAEGGETGAVREFPVAPATPTEFKTASIGVELQVKADILPDGMIELDLSPRVSEFAGYLNFGAPIHQMKDGKLDGLLLSENKIEMPIFDEVSHRTKVRVPETHTLVIGGFVNDRTVHIEDKLPVLGLVTDSKTVVERRRVFVFITPQFIDPVGMTVK